MNHAHSKLLTIALASACACSAATAQDAQIGEVTASSETWDRLTATGASITGACNASANDSINDGVPYEIYYIRTGSFSPILDIRVDSHEPTPLDFDPFIAVYCDSFDPNLPNTNLLHVDDDSAGYPNAHASFPFVGLPSNSLYIAVVSSYSNFPQSQYGNFQISIGPGLHFSRRCLADFNDDGEVDFVDVSTFISYYTSMDPRADLNYDGSNDFVDINLFLTAFAAGCP